MFVYTAKFSKKKAIAIILVLAAILCAIIIIASRPGGEDKGDYTVQTAATTSVVKNNGQRVKFLKNLGWEVDENAIEEQQVVIPRSFSDVYEQYNRIQLAQGFDLSKFAGVEATRYTYRVLNYPGANGEVVADIVVYRNEVIAGDVQSRALDGFMAGLAFPAGS